MPKVCVEAQTQIKNQWEFINWHMWFDDNCGFILSNKHTGPSHGIIEYWRATVQQHSMFCCRRMPLARRLVLGWPHKYWTDGRVAHCYYKLGPWIYCSWFWCGNIKLHFKDPDEQTLHEILSALGVPISTRTDYASLVHDENRNKEIHHWIECKNSYDFEGTEKVTTTYYCVFDDFIIPVTVSETDSPYVGRYIKLYDNYEEHLYCSDKARFVVVSHMDDVSHRQARKAVLDDLDNVISSVQALHRLVPWSLFWLHITVPGLRELYFYFFLILWNRLLTMFFHILILSHKL